MCTLIRWMVGLTLTLGLTMTLTPARADEPPTGTPTESTTAAATEGSTTVSQAGSKKKIKIAKRCKTKGRVLCIDKTRRKAFYVRKGKVIKTMDARFGCAGTATRQGTFKVFRKNKHWTSTIYHTKMPYSMFFSGGQAVHYSADFKRRGYAGCSHGCVNTRKKSTIRYVFKRIRVGDRVVVYRS